MARWARAVSGFSLVLFVMSGLGHRYGVVDTRAFVWLLGIVAMLALSGLALAAGGFWRLWEHGDIGGRNSLRATVLSLIVLAPYLAGAYFAVRYPPLTDISTDLVEPPHFMLAQRARTGDMNRITAITRQEADLQLRHGVSVRTRRRRSPLVPT